MNTKLSIFSSACLSATLLAALPAQAAKPGAFSVTETKSAIGNKAAKPPRTKDRCIGPELVDKDGFLYPDLILSKHFSQCRIKDSKLLDKNTKTWTVVCGKMLTAQAKQVNTGEDFHLHIDAALLGGAMKQTLDYEAQSLKRQCTPEDEPLE
ncbi:hypothetical protein GCM10027276_31760 [Comamonas piscis]